MINDYGLLMNGSGRQTILLVGTGIVSVFQSTDTNQTAEESNHCIYVYIHVYTCIYVQLNMFK
jgi:hypothetical protein